MEPPGRGKGIKKAADLLPGEGFEDRRARFVVKFVPELMLSHVNMCLYMKLNMCLYI